MDLNQAGSNVVLVVDDHAMVLTAVRLALESEGYQILAAPSGQEALAVCEVRANPVHLALLDIVMPGMTGFELLSRLRKVFPSIRVLFMSGYPAAESFDQAGLAMEDEKFIGKPFTSQQLREAVKKALE